jgi:hypothetical protein
MDEFTQARYKRLARDFVDIYESDKVEGPRMAGELAVQELPECEYIHFEPFVTQEFRDRGYVFESELD